MGKGFVSSFRELDDLVRKSLALLGAGSAAQAIGIERTLANCSNISP